MARERIQTILDVSGGLGTLIVGHTEVGDPAAQRNGFELIARDVISYFNGRSRLV
jgi:hypothetical protein